jgi:hypothetical protein
MVATLGELHHPPGWVWVHCTRYVPLCQHRAPMALAPLVIRWGPDASSRQASTLRSLHRLRPQGRDVAASRLDRVRLLDGWPEQLAHFSACWR